LIKFLCIFSPKPNPFTMRRLIFFSAILFFSASLSAQQGGKQYNSLLWRIAGNGLTKPSYLYGTIHLNDKKLFFFGDSLYKALEQTEGFAAELDMASVATEYINMMLGDKDDESPSVKDVLGEKKLDQYKAQLEKKFGKPVSKITAKEVENEEQTRSTKMFAKGEMKTFMDAYLFDLAYKQGKWTGGIEDLEDQVGHNKESLEEKLDDLFTPRERTDKTIDWMINLYLKQDLDVIDRTDEIWRGSRDSILLRRNVKMGRRIDSLAHIRSCLFAIGAAHLPGDSGVVSLLRSRGFTVTPVSSSRKIAPEKYTYKTVDRPWLNVETRDSLYTLQMPGKADAINMYPDMPFDMKMYFDMGSMTVYLTLGLQTATVKEDKKDSLLSRVAERYKNKNSDFREKNITVGTERGKEFTMNNEYGEFRLQAFVPGNFLVINGIFSLNKETIAAAIADRFFQSFKSNNRPVTAPVAENEKWQTYTFSNHAFSVSLPGKYRTKKNDQPDVAWNEKTYEVLDVPGNAYYGIFIGENKPGYYSSEDSTYFKRAEESLEAKLETKKISSRQFEINGFPAFESIMKTGKEGEIIGLKILLLNRGNRRYFLLSTYDLANSASPDRFFSSFTLLPLPKVKWHLETAPDKTFRVWSSSPVTLQMDSVDNLSRYRIYDSAAPVSIHIDKNILSPYYWAANDSLLFDQRIKTFIGYNDSLLEYKKIKNGSVNGVDLLIQLGGTHNLKKMRLLLNGDTVYTVFGFMPKESLETEDYKKVFDDFRITTEVSPVKLYERKPGALLKAFQSKDSAVFAKAKEAFETVIFEKADLPLLQQALLYQYQDFDTGYYSSNINGKIATAIIELDSNHTSVSFIKDNYSKITPERELIKPFLLSVLGRIKTSESYSLLKEIIIKQPPAIETGYYFSHDLYDSLKLSRQLYPEVFSRAADPGLSWLINGIGVSLLDSNLLGRNDLLPYKDIFIAAAKKELARPAEELEDIAGGYADLIKLLGVLNLPEANAQLNRFGKLNDKATRMQVITALLKNNQPVDRKDIYTLATTDEFRSELYNELKELGKLNLFPPDYLSQKHLGQSELYGYATDDEPPQSLKYIGERTELFMGKKQKFYLYKVAFDETDPEYTYLGIAGPYSLNPKDYSSTHDATSVIWSEKFDAKKTDAMFKKHLADMEKDLKADKND
jgi:uncharacterized protein YbaP (TraB family)